MKNINPFTIAWIFLAIFVITLIILMVDSFKTDSAGFVIETKHAIVNKRKFQKEILEAYKDCASANKNRDVVYNDTNELANTCKTYSLNLYDANDEKYAPSIRSQAFQELENEGKL